MWEVFVRPDSQSAGHFTLDISFPVHFAPNPNHKFNPNSNSNPNTNPTNPNPTDPTITLTLLKAGMV